MPEPNTLSAAEPASAGAVLRTPPATARSAGATAAARTIILLGAAHGRSGCFDRGVLAKDRLTELFLEHEEFFTERGLMREDGIAELTASSLGALPGFDALLQAEIGYFTYNAQNERTLLRSDLGDVLHCAYIPYVDLFRCDQHTADRVQALAAGYGTQVVSPATKLIEAIKKAAAERGLI